MWLVDVEWSIRAPGSGVIGFIAVAAALVLAIAIAATRKGMHKWLSSEPVLPVETKPPSVREVSHDDRGAEVSSLVHERRELIEVCISVRDLVTGEALRDRLRMALERVGITTLEPQQGELVEPTSHRVIKIETTKDGSLHNRIAAVTRPGYSDRGQLMQEADVVVYQVKGRSDD